MLQRQVLHEALGSYPCPPLEKALKMKLAEPDLGGRFGQGRLFASVGLEETNRALDARVIAGARAGRSFGMNARHELASSRLQSNGYHDVISCGFDAPRAHMDCGSRPSCASPPKRQATRFLLRPTTWRGVRIS
jgi:hypothetical protein